MPAVGVSGCSPHDGGNSLFHIEMYMYNVMNDNDSLLTIQNTVTKFEKNKHRYLHGHHPRKVAVPLWIDRRPALSPRDLCFTIHKVNRAGSW